MFSSIHTLSAAVAAGLLLMMTPSPLAAQEKSTSLKPIEIGTRLELFVDDHLVERMTGVAFRLHAPVKQAPAKSPLPSGPYGTILKDGDLYRAYYRSDIPGYEIGRQTRNADNEPNEITCYAESRDGIEWTFPDLGITEIQSSKGGNVILARQVPFTHNFTPFLDSRPGVGPDARYKALAGSGGTGLVAFKSADGIHWSKIQDAPVVKTPSSAPGTPWPFDGPSPAFWSEAENCYVCFVRTWGKIEPPQTDPHKKFQRRVSRTTSTDFITWTPLVDTGANLPGEQLYTSQTHPYFRAPHIYIATMMRFTQGMERGEPVEGNNGSSDIVLMTMRAGSAAYQRTFREAFIRPGLDPQRWERKANSAWLNVVPTGDAEMSIYHINGDRYTLRTDGFISVNAGADGGELLTKPLIFAGNALFVNFSTGAAGSLRVEIQDASGRALPGFGLEDCQALIGDAIERRVRWKNNPDLAAIAGKPVRLRFALRECDLYSFRLAPRGWEGDPVTVGAIRWDAWHTPVAATAHGGAGGPVKAMEASLNPHRYRWRAPFFARVDTHDTLRIDGYTQEVLDREIAYAKAGGLDYWAFLLYAEDNCMSQGLSLYLSSPRRRDVNFCAIAGPGTFGERAAWEAGVARVVRYMKEPGYQTVCGGRPLLYLMRFQPEDKWIQAWGGPSGARELLARLRAGARAAGLGDPYVVVMNEGPAAQVKRVADTVGANAISDYARQANGAGAPYAELAGEARAYWNACAATGAEVVPLAMAGWDRRPRVERPVPWEAAWQKPNVGLDKFYVLPTPEELAAHVEEAMASAEQCPAKTVIVYAWNEHDEGGWLCPTLGAGGKPDASRLEAIGRMRESRAHQKAR